MKTTVCCSDIDEGVNSRQCTMMRESRYRECLAKGNAAKLNNDLTTALAMYKIAKNYAKDPAEVKEISNLINATTPGAGDP